MINPEKFYSLIEAQKLTGIKSRQYLADYIKDGYLLAIKVGGKKEGVRYAILGSHIISFKEKLAEGSLKNDKYSIKELKMLLHTAIKFCEQHGIKTLADLINKVNNLK